MGGDEYRFCVFLRSLTVFGFYGVLYDSAGTSKGDWAWCLEYLDDVLLLSFDDSAEMPR
jgi:hypothetical protein